MDDKPFSQQLEGWLKDHTPKTLGNLEKVFAEKSFAIIIMLLMAPSALPIPTGGVTNVLEVIVMLLALELMIGRRVIWLPKKWKKLKISHTAEDKLVPALAKKIRWLERFSKPRLRGLLRDPNFLKVTGLVIFVLTFGAFFSPPFTGLDTLPSLGVVLICLALILDDVVLYLIGCAIGGIGVALAIGFGKVIIEAIKAIF
jgi:hypothetical protein